MAPSSPKLGALPGLSDLLMFFLAYPHLKETYLDQHAFTSSRDRES